MTTTPLSLVISCVNCTERIPFDIKDMFKDPNVATYRLYCERCGYGNLFRRPKKVQK